MALDTNTILIAVGLMIAGAFIGSVVFRRFRVPDIIFLIGLGVLLGPTFHFVDVQGFRDVAPLVGTIAIIIILFDGGLEIKFADIGRGVLAGVLLGLLVFSATTLLCALPAHVIAGMPVENSVLLGMTFGGAGVVIVIPLIQHLGVQPGTRTLVSIEAAVSDVLVVTGVIGLSTAIALEQSDPAHFARELTAHFAIAILAGILVGWFWAVALRTFAEDTYEYVLTMAVLFLAYATVELLHGSGPVAVLIAGLVIGNSRKTSPVPTSADLSRRGPRKRRWEYVPVFGVDLQNFHHEMVFFIRAFFFVALGVTLRPEVFAEGRFLLVGVFLALAVMLGRFWGVGVLFWRSRFPAWDKVAIALMFPVGLAAAALSLVPFHRFHIAGTEDFGSYAAVVIVLTNLASTVLVYGVSRPGIRQRLPGSEGRPAPAMGS